MDPGVRLVTETLKAVGVVFSQGDVLHRGADGLIARPASGGDRGIGRLPVQHVQHSLAAGLPLGEGLAVEAPPPEQVGQILRRGVQQARKGLLRDVAPVELRQQP